MMLAVTTGLLIFGILGYTTFLRPEEPESFLMSALTVIFIIAFFSMAISAFIYAIFLFVNPKPTLVFDSTGLSQFQNAPKAPWDHVEVIERVIIPGMNSQRQGLAIRFVETSEFKSHRIRSAVDWDRKEKYDLVVLKQHCDIPLDDLERQLRSLLKQQAQEV